MNWEFKSADIPPDVGRGGMKCFVLLVEHDNGRRCTIPAYYLNRYPLEMEDCRCDEEHDDGCPITGWFYDESNFEYEHCYHRVEGKVLAYAEIPDAETAMNLWNGGPW